MQEGSVIGFARESIWLPSSDSKSIFSKSSRSSVVVEPIRRARDEEKVPPTYTKSTCSSVVEPIRLARYEDRAPPDLEEGMWMGKRLIAEVFEPVRRTSSADPELPRPLMVKGVTQQKKLYKNGNSWEIVDSARDKTQGW